MNRRSIPLGALTVCAMNCLAATTTANFIESEPNDSKSAANVLTLQCGDTVSGASTGASSSPGAASADYFRLRAAAGPAGIYRYRLALTAGADGHIPSLRGLTQSGAGVVQAGTDTDLQFSSAGTTPPRYDEWYDFGGGGEVFFRVIGSAGAGAGYTAALSCETITPVDAATPLAAGQITISTVGQGHSTDTDMWVYDAQFRPLAGFGNDNEGPNGPTTGSRLTRNFAPGVYYLALSNFNLANDQSSSMADEDFHAGNVADFAGVAINANAVVGIPLTVAFQAPSQSFQIAATKSTPYEIVWIRFTVASAAEMGACCLASGCSTNLSSQCASQGGLFAGAGSNCAQTNCAGIGCQTATVIANTPFSLFFDNGSLPATAPRGSCNDETVTQMQNAAWFSWTPAVNATAILTVTPEDEFGYDAIVAVYSGACNNLVESACGDEPQPIRVTFCALADVTYYIECGSYGADNPGGPTTIELVTQQPTGACCVPTGGCSVFTQPECAARGGAYVGDCVPCATANCPAGGACCINASCTIRTVASCASAGGVHGGVGTLCFTPTGEPPLTFSVTPNIPIPDFDPGGISSNLTVPQNTPGVDVNVFVNIPNHTFISDLLISLAHNGHTRILWDRSCSNEHGLNAVFDDEGSNNNCEQPTVGPLKPSLFGNGLLEIFEQEPIGGVWTLTVSDNASPDTGTLVSWGLVITPGRSACAASDCMHGDTNCNGAVNNFDIDPFVEALVNGSSQAATQTYLNSGGTQACWDRRACWGDVNRDQAFNNFDIDPFVACILNLPAPGAECP